MKNIIFFGNVGCFVKLKGSRNKHKVINEEHIGNNLPNLVQVVELCTNDIINTTWKNLTLWK